jgi:hypothetical protein
MLLAGLAHTVFVVESLSEAGLAMTDPTTTKGAAR